MNGWGWSGAYHYHAGVEQGQVQVMDVGVAGVVLRHLCVRQPGLGGTLGSEGTEQEGLEWLVSCTLRQQHPSGHVHTTMSTSSLCFFGFCANNYFPRACNKPEIKTSHKQKLRAQRSQAMNTRELTVCINNRRKWFENGIVFTFHIWKKKSMQ